MPVGDTRMVLWTGPRHSGKTTSVGALVGRARERGFEVAGLLAPAVYEDRRLIGFDVLDLGTGVGMPLSHVGRGGVEQVGAFSLTKEGLEFGCKALDLTVVGRADLIVVDEFGPLELRGRGWRRAVDTLLCPSGSVSGLILLVVRQELALQVSRLYNPVTCPILQSSQDTAVDALIDMLAQ